MNWLQAKPDASALRRFFLGLWPAIPLVLLALIFHSKHGGELRSLMWMATPLAIWSLMQALLLLVRADYGRAEFLADSARAARGGRGGSWVGAFIRWHPESFAASALLWGIAIFATWCGPIAEWMRDPQNQAWLREVAILLPLALLGYLPLRAAAFLAHAYPRAPRSWLLALLAIELLLAQDLLETAARSAAIGASESSHITIIREVAIALLSYRALSAGLVVWRASLLETAAHWGHDEVRRGLLDSCEAFAHRMWRLLQSPASERLFVPAQSPLLIRCWPVLIGIVPGLLMLTSDPELAAIPVVTWLRPDSPVILLLLASAAAAVFHQVVVIPHRILRSGVFAEWAVIPASTSEKLHWLLAPAAPAFALGLLLCWTSGAVAIACNSGWVSVLNIFYYSLGVCLIASLCILFVALLLEQALATTSSFLAALVFLRHLFVAWLPCLLLSGLAFAVYWESAPATQGTPITLAARLNRLLSGPALLLLIQAHAPLLGWLLAAPQRTRLAMRRALENAGHA